MTKLDVRIRKPPLRLEIIKYEPGSALAKRLEVSPPSTLARSGSRLRDPDWTSSRSLWDSS